MKLIFDLWCSAIQNGQLLEFEYRKSPVRVAATYARLESRVAAVVLEGLRVGPQGLPTAQTAERFDYRDISNMRAIEVPHGLRGDVWQRADGGSIEVALRNART